MKKFSAIFILVIVVWIFSAKTSWNIVSGSAEKAPLVSAYTVEDFRLSAECVGFTGHCAFPQYGLKLDLEFSGLVIKKPFYRMSFAGGSDGFIISSYYFGTRRLKITFEKTGQTVIFEKTLWNVQNEDGFTDLIQFRTMANELYIATDHNAPGATAFRFKLK